MSFQSRRIGIVVGALAALAGCGQKPSLPPGLPAVDPGAPTATLRALAPSFHPIGSEPSLLVSDEEYLCFGPGRAIALDDALMTVSYRRNGAGPSPRRCYDDTVRHPPARWARLGEYVCGVDPAARREAYFAIDGRWGARVADASVGPDPHVEVVFVADTDARADQRRAAADRSCHPPR